HASSRVAAAGRLAAGRVPPRKPARRCGAGVRSFPRDRRQSLSRSNLPSPRAWETPSCEETPEWPARSARATPRLPESAVPAVAVPWFAPECSSHAAFHENGAAVCGSNSSIVRSAALALCPQTADMSEILEARDDGFTDG